MDAPGGEVTTIDEYISLFPDEVKSKLQALRAAIKEVAPEAKETIKYRMPTFTLNGNLIYFAAFKNHIGLYPTSSALEETIPEVTKYRMGKGTLQLAMDQPLPLPLIREIVELRVKENLEKIGRKKYR